MAKEPTEKLLFEKLPNYKKIPLELHLILISFLNYISKMREVC